MWIIQHFSSFLIKVLLAVYFNQDYYVNWKQVFSVIIQHVEFENKISKQGAHGVTGLTFVVGLHNYADDETVIKFIIKKTTSTFSYNVIIDVPTTDRQLVYFDKTSHSNSKWNEKVFADANRPSYDSIVKMLELNMDNKIIFVLERLTSDF